MEGQGNKDILYNVLEGLCYENLCNDNHTNLSHIIVAMVIVEGVVVMAVDLSSKTSQIGP